MHLPMHTRYGELVEKARASHEQGRRSDLIGPDDIALARLYCYGLRTHTIGAFHATALAVKALQPQDPVSQAHLQRVSEQLEDLANLGMEPVPDDYRVVIATLYRYHRGVHRVIDALEQAHRAAGTEQLDKIRNRFGQLMGEITSSEGLYLVPDNEAPELASFEVPNLGITIVPLVYGDHHSWNLAHLSQEHLDVPMHWHRSGVEIHLGYEPLEGYMILGDCKAPVKEGYAMPIPPTTRHGWVNRSDTVHHVPFIFGSLIQAGWGIFFDVEPRPLELEALQTVGRTDWQMGASVFLNREIAAMQKLIASRRRVLIPAGAMDRNGSGGLELAASRVNESGLTLPVDGFRIVSVASGQGLAQIGPVECRVRAHDHFGVPAGMTASLQQDGDEPMVVLDALIKGIAHV